MPKNSSISTDVPVVGVSGASAESASVQVMLARVRETGAAALLLANHVRRVPENDIKKCDAVIVMGNNYDIDPALYGAEPHPQTRSTAGDKHASARMAYEQKLIAFAMAEKMPLFAICGGMQLINVLQGGTLHQHIPDLIGHDRHARNAGEKAAYAVIHVNIVGGTLLDRIVSEHTLAATGVPPLVGAGGAVNAFHHQAIDKLGKDLIACAHSVEGGYELIEAIEASPTGALKDQFLLGVQWHPEFLPEATDKILRDMQQAALAFAQSQNRTHSPEEIKMENILSALPILKSVTDFARDHNTPPSDKPKGRGR